jgi:carotenoid isomerooxygenase
LGICASGAGAACDFHKKVASYRINVRNEHMQAQPQEDQQLAKEDHCEDCYPNCDISIWLRSCGTETIEPIQGITFGSIPDWINGCLYRNGPGKQHYDRQSVNHLFDASGLLHKSVAPLNFSPVIENNLTFFKFRFKIKKGQVTYQSRYVKSKAYERNMAAQQVVVAEFTTPAAPDPCKTIFHR